MSATINQKRQSLGIEFAKRTAGLIAGASKDYIKEVFPNVSSTLTDARSELSKIQASTVGLTQTTARIRGSVTFRNVFNWYMTAGKEFEDNIGDSLDYDIPDVEGSSDESSDAASISAVYSQQSEKNANKIAKAVIESSSALASAQLGSTSEIVNELQKVNSSIAAGFDTTNKLLSNILEVLTKNTAALIETNLGALSTQKDSAGREMQMSGKFSIAGYKDIISKNIQNTPGLGMMAAFLPMLGSLKNTIGPQDLIQMGLSAAINKAAPNFKKTAQDLDNAVNDAIMRSLVRLGSNDRGGLVGQISRLFGIDTRRQEVAPTRSSLEVKAVPFDSLTRESITKTIPEYLRKILVALGGKDEVYDYRRRQFTTQRELRNEYRSVQAHTGSMSSANRTIQRTFGTDQFGQMMYDLLLADMGGDAGSSTMIRNKRNTMRNQNTSVEYMKQLLGGGKFTDADLRRLNQIASNLSKDEETGVLDEMAYQASRRNITRQESLKQFNAQMDLYNMDVGNLTDTVKDELRAIRAQYGRKPQYGSGQQQATATASSRTMGALSGVDYTNRALYQIFRRLDTGLNVYVTGHEDTQIEPYPSMLRELPPPMGIRSRLPSKPKRIEPNSEINGNAPEMEENLLLNGEDENLTAGERFSRWGRKRGSQFINGIKNGDSDAIRGAIIGSIDDVGGVVSDQLKKGASRLNDSFGNITGWLKHKFTGAGYSYMDGDTKVTVKDNAKGGILGFIKGEFMESFNNAKVKGKDWFNRVAGYFDYGDDKPGEDGTAKKRRRFIGASVGALAGAGILGGPIGLILGAVAGNALSGLDIGAKIKELLFGHKDDGTPTGLFAKFADSMITPIKFQLEKTFAKGKAVLEKRILGPLSDIGFAIKERAKKAADATFGRAFRFIGRIITAPFKAVGKGFGKLVTGSFNLMNRLFRGSMSVSGAAAGGILSGIANIIAPDSDVRKQIKDRRKQRNQQIDDELKDPNGVYKISYKQYRQKQRERRRDMYKKFQGYTAEDIQRESVDVQQQTAENTLNMSDNIKDIKDMQEESTKRQEKDSDRMQEVADHMLKTDGEHSIFTHDHGVHKYLEQIINILTGNQKNSNGIKSSSTGGKVLTADSPEVKASVNPPKLNVPMLPTAKNLKKIDPTDSDDYANAVLGGISSIASANGEFSDEEAEVAKAAVNESSRNNSDKGRMRNYFMNIIDSQKKKGKEKAVQEEKKESLLEKLAGGIGSFFGGGFISLLTKALPFILGALGLGALFNIDWGDAISKIKDFLSRISTGFSNLLDFFGIGNGNAKSDDATTEAANALGSIVDTNTTSIWNYAIPGASLVHVKTDAAGNNITNATATHAKDEVLYLSPLRHEIQGPVLEQTMANFRRRQANNAAAKAADYAGRAAQARAKGGITGAASSSYNQARSNYYQNKANQKNAKADQWQAKADATPGSTVRGIARQAARVGTISVAGNVVNWGASKIAEKAGLSEESANTIGNAAEVAVSGGLIYNSVKAPLKGKKSIVDKIIDGFMQAMDWIGNKLKSTKAFSKVAGKIDDIIKKLKGALPVSSFTDDIVKKIEAKIAASVGKQAAGAASLGIGILVGAVAGAVSGACSVENLFEVSPGDADALMTTIATALQGVFGGLEMVPALGTVCLVFDILDSVVRGFLGTGIRQFLAQSLYKLIGDEEVLEEKQAKFQGHLDDYNAKYGSNLGMSEFNDLTNNTGAIDKLWRGSMKYDEEGNMVFDKAGGRINTGLSTVFTGGETDYVTNENGEVVRREDGTAVKKVDAYGTVQKVDERWGDKVAEGFNRAKNFVLGGAVYKTDEQGNAVIDPETGEYVVDHYEKNIIGKGIDTAKNIGSTIVSAGGAVINKGKEIVGGVVDTAKNIGGAVVNKAKDLGSKAVDTAKNIGSTIVGGISGAANFVGGLFGFGNKEEEKSDEDTKATNTAKSSSKLVGGAITSGIKSLTPEQQKKLKEVGTNIKDGITNVVGKIGSFLKNPIESAKSVINEINKDDAEYDENGNIIQKAGSTVKNVLKKGFSAITNLFKKPAEEASEVIQDDETNKTFTMNEDGSIISKVAKTQAKISGSKAGAYYKSGNKVTGGISSLLKTAHKKLTDLFTAPGKAVSEIVQEENNAEYETDEEGNKVEGINTDKNSRTAVYVKKGSLKDFIKTGLGKLTSFITSPFKEMEKGAIDWEKNDSPWSKEKNKSGTSSNQSTGVFGWIKGKISSIWDGITNGINGAVEGANSNSSNRSSSSRRNVGGPKGKFIGEVGSPDPAEDMDAMAATAMPTQTVAGGNPLSKAFTVTSPYGYRTLDKGSEFHKGIDIVPSDGSGQADVSARYEGKVIGMRRDLPDSHSGLGVSSKSEGNYVTIETPDGQNRIKYFHLKANSIPSGINNGSTVNIGDKIGSMGSTGRSTGPHLHYQLERKNSSGQFETYDPYSDISGSGANGNPANDPYGSMTSSFSADESSEGTGALAQLLSKLQTLGSEFLNKISLGLFSSDTSSSSDESSSGASATGAGLSVEQFLAMCAAEIGTSEDPPGSNNIKYNTWFYGHAVSGDDYPWCMAFVQWCFNNAGLPLEHKSAGCADMWDWYNDHEPDMCHTSNPEPGDIMIMSGHTGIVESVEGTTIHTIEGNTSDTVARRNQPASKAIGYIRPVDWSALASIGNGNYGAIDTSVGGLWKYIKQMGFNDIGAAGVLGCWENESANDAQTIEGDYLSIFKKTFGTGDAAYRKAAQDRALLSSYADQVIARTPSVTDPSKYVASDGYKYPGFGYAQWTAGRAKQLIETAAKSNVDWWNPAFQLSFANMEMTDPNNYRGPNHANPKGKMKDDTSPEEAADTFSWYYEGIKGTASRRQSARRLYNTYAGTGGKLNDTTPVGDMNEHIGSMDDLSPSTNRTFGGVGGTVDNQTPMRIRQAKARFFKQNKVNAGSLQRAATIAKGQFSNTKRATAVKGPTGTFVGGVGGPLDDNTAQSNAIKAATKQKSVRQNTYRVKTNPATAFTVDSTKVNPVNTPILNVMQNGGNNDVSGIIALLSQAIEYLKSITSNTGNSAMYLNALNGKNFVDQGLRDTLNSLGKVKHPSNELLLGTSATSKAATELARP